jgi:hypothetical protein
MNGARLPFLLPWLKVNLLIRSITRQTWPDNEWRILRPRLRRALEIRGRLRQAGRWN